MWTWISYVFLLWCFKCGKGIEHFLGEKNYVCCSGHEQAFDLAGRPGFVKSEITFRPFESARASWSALSCQTPGGTSTSTDLPWDLLSGPRLGSYRWQQSGCLLALSLRRWRNLHFVPPAPASLRLCQPYCLAHPEGPVLLPPPSCLLLSFSFFHPPFCSFASYLWHSGSNRPHSSIWMCLLISDLESSAEPTYNPPWPLWCLKPRTPSQVFSRCSHFREADLLGCLPQTHLCWERFSLLGWDVQGSFYHCVHPVLRQKIQLSNPRVDPPVGGSLDTTHHWPLGVQPQCGGWAVPPVLPVPLLLWASQIAGLVLFPEVFVLVKNYFPMQKQLGYAKSIPSVSSPLLNGNVNIYIRMTALREFWEMQRMKDSLFVPRSWLLQSALKKENKYPEW